MATRKDMEHMSMLVGADTSGNGCRVTCTAMEYSDGQMEMYTMDNGNKIRKMVMRTRGGLMATNTMDSTKMI
jgi:diacylglycerol kinase family enzyme